MKKISKKTLTLSVCSLVFFTMAVAIIAYLTDFKSKINNFNVDKANEYNVIHRLIGSSTTTSETINFDASSLIRLYEGQKIYTNYYDGYTADEKEISSKTTYPNGYFLNSYNYEDKEYKFKNAPTTYTDIFETDENNTEKDLKYQRIIDGILGKYNIGYGVSNEAQQLPETKKDIYYDYQPIDYTITFDLHKNFITDTVGEPTLKLSDAQKTTYASVITGKDTEDEILEAYGVKQDGDYYVGTYNVFKGMEFPRAEWSGYTFLGWRVVSDDHYDKKTDEYTNYNFRNVAEDGDPEYIKNDKFAYGINCWVAVTAPAEISSREYFDYLEQKDGDRNYYREYQGAEADADKVQTPLMTSFLSAAEDHKTLDGTTIPLYDTEEVIELLKHRSTGNIIVEAVWEVPDLIVTYDTSYIKSQFANADGLFPNASFETNTDGLTTKNVVRYEYDGTGYKIKKGGGQYAEPVFDYAAPYQYVSSVGDYGVKTKTVKSPYIQNWTTTRLEKGTSENIVSPEPTDYFKLELNTARDGITGSGNYIKEDESNLSYPTQDSVAGYYNFMQETVYKGDSISKIDVAKLKADGLISTSSDSNGKTVYNLTIYGYVKPRLTVQGIADLVMYQHKDNGFGYSDSDVQYDYIAKETNVGETFEFSRCSYQQDFLDNYFDPRIVEKQTGDRGYVFKDDEARKSSVRGKYYAFPRKYQKYGSKTNYTFEGWQYYDTYQYVYRNNYDMEAKQDLSKSTVTFAGKDGNDDITVSVNGGVITPTTTSRADLVEYDAFNGIMNSGFIKQNGLTITADHYYKHNSTDLSGYYKSTEKKFIVFAKWSTAGHIKLEFHSNYGDDETTEKYIAVPNDTEKDTDLPPCTFTRDGYDFNGWALDSDGTRKISKYSDFATLNAGQTKTVYATWIPAGFWVKYDKNGGSGSMLLTDDSQDDNKQRLTTTSSKPYGTLAENKFNHSNAEFIAWNTKADGTGTFYRNGQIVYETSDDIVNEGGIKTLTLYAMWSDKYITYNANGGKFADGEATNDVYYAGRMPSLHYNPDKPGVYEIPERTGYEFGGWEGEDAYSSSISFTDINIGEINSSLTDHAILKAVWNEFTIPVYFNPNEGYGSITAETLSTVAGSSIILKSEAMLEGMKPAQGFHRSGYVLAGWALTSSAKEPLIEDGGVLDYNEILREYRKLTGRPTANLDSITLYAVWKDSSTYNVDYNANGGSGAPASQTTDKNNEVTIPESEVNNNNHKLLGWSTSETAYKDDTAKVYQTKDQARFYENGTLYAQWYYYAELFDEIDATAYDVNALTAITSGSAAKATDSKALKASSTNGGWLNVGFNKYRPEIGSEDYIVEAKVSGSKALLTLMPSLPNDTTKEPNIGAYELDGNEHTVKYVVRQSEKKVEIYVDDVLYASKSVECDTLAKGLHAVLQAGGSINIDDIYVYSNNALTTITYHSTNDGSDGEEKYSTKVYFEPYKIDNNKFTAPEGKTFGGWATTAGSSAKYKANDELSGSELKAVTDLYAYWRNASVTFKANGGTGDDYEVESDDDGNVTIPTNITAGIANGRYVFLGWSDKEEAWKESDAVIYTGSGTENMHVAEDTTLYAQWYYYGDDFADGANEYTIVEFYNTNSAQRPTVSYNGEMLVNNGQGSGRAVSIKMDKVSVAPEYKTSYVAEAKVKFRPGSNTDHSQQFAFVSDVSGADNNTPPANTLFILQSTTDSASEAGQTRYIINRDSNDYIDLTDQVYYTIRVCVDGNKATTYILNGETLVKIVGPYDVNSNDVYGIWANNRGKSNGNVNGMTYIDDIYTYSVEPITAIKYYPNTSKSDEGTPISTNVYFAPYTVADPTALGFTAPAGKVFAGWGTSADGSGDYQPGDTVEEADLSTISKLYAIWDVGYTLEYNSGGTVISSSTVYPSNFSGGQTISLDITPEDREGYVFKGWMTDENGTTAITELDEEAFNANLKDGTVTVYAKWSQLSTVTYNTTKYLVGSNRYFYINSSNSVVDYTQGYANVYFGDNGYTVVDVKYTDDNNAYRSEFEDSTYTNGFAQPNKLVTSSAITDGRTISLKLMGWIKQSDVESVWGSRGNNGTLNDTATQITDKNSNTWTIQPYSATGALSGDIVDGTVYYPVWKNGGAQSVKVNFNANYDGESAIESITLNVGDTIDLTEIFTRSGYTLAGWAAKADGSGYTNDLLTFTADETLSEITIYAKWTRVNGTMITFKGGYGASEPEAEYKVFVPTGESYELLSNTDYGFTAGSGQAFKFIGWDTEVDASGMGYKAKGVSDSGTGGIITGAEDIEDITLYGIWFVESNNYRVVFNANTGNLSAGRFDTSDGHSHGLNYMLYYAYNGVSPTGKYDYYLERTSGSITYKAGLYKTANNNGANIFDHWSQENGVDNKYTNINIETGMLYNPISIGVNLHAWYISASQVKDKVNYNSNGGSGTAITQEIDRGATTTTAPENTYYKDDSKFLYWTLDEAGNGTQYSKGSTINLSTAEYTTNADGSKTYTVYAQWKTYRKLGQTDIGSYTTGWVVANNTTNGTANAEWNGTVVNSVSIDIDPTLGSYVSYKLSENNKTRLAGTVFDFNGGTSNSYTYNFNVKLNATAISNTSSDTTSCGFMITAGSDYKNLKSYYNSMATSYVLKLNSEKRNRTTATGPTSWTINGDKSVAVDNGAWINVSLTINNGNAYLTLRKADDLSSYYTDNDGNSIRNMLLTTSSTDVAGFEFYTSGRRDGDPEFGVTDIYLYEGTFDELIDAGVLSNLTLSSIDIYSFDVSVVKSFEYDITASSAAIIADIPSAIETTSINTDIKSVNKVTSGTVVTASITTDDTDTDEPIITPVEPIIPESDIPKTEPELITTQPVKKPRDDDDEDDTETVETVEEIIVEEEDETEKVLPEEPEEEIPEDAPFDADEFISQVLDESALPAENE